MAPPGSIRIDAGRDDLARRLRFTASAHRALDQRGNAMRCALLAILLLVPCGVAAQQQPSLSDVRTVLGPLIESYGISGMEGPVREAVNRMLPAWARATTDSAGDLIVSVGEGEPLVVFVAHLDEIGYVVTAIREDGTLELKQRGG